MANKQMNPQELKIIFMGTPEFGALILKAMVENGYRPVLVVTVPDKPVGRKKILTPPPVKIEAEKQGIEIRQPKKIKEILEEMKDIQPDLIITAAYSKILPKDVLDLPKSCINIHPSLLPKYRGPSPVQHAILNGDKKTGVTIMLMDEQIDHGAILAQKEMNIDPKETGAGLHTKLALLGSNLLLEVIPAWLAGEIKAIPQNHSLATFTKILKRDDGLIDWDKSPEEIERKIRAFTPWPGAYTFFDKNGVKTRLKILESFLENGKLVLVLVQPEGKKQMAFSDFLRGNPQFKNNEKICLHIQI
jgi:methionyl-tRNA formyltransferase